MSKNQSFKIIERPNEIDDHLLDIIGREFKFDHEKGLAEWLKNSVDAYLRKSIPDSEQFVIFRFTDGNNDDGMLECVDFVGMSSIDIEKALIRWGDPEAAKRGLNKRVYGGHGNGGKFYMRQMFDSSHFITYRDGYLNVFGFNPNKKYGFADSFQDKKTKPEEALKFAGLDKMNIPADLKKKILTNETGFTVVKGVGPAGMKNKIKAAKIAEKMKSHPQARRLLLHKHISLIHNGNTVYEILRPDEIKSLPNFEEPKMIEIPSSIITEDSEGEKVAVELANKKFAPGKLVLKTSEEALQGGRYSDLNRIDFIGEIGESDKTVIATYELYELGVRTFPQAAFIYGECSCPILEDPENDCVKNDRTKLVPNGKTKALLEWVRVEIDRLASDIATKEAQSQEETAKKVSSAYNDFLNQWKNKWMRKILSEMFLKGTETTGTGTGIGGKLGKLQAPVSGFEFRFAQADIPFEESYPLTLKASVPQIIPIGSIINVTSDNNLIELEDSRITIKSDYVKLTEDGEEVAVMNVFASGKRLGEKATITAKTGKYETKIEVNVVEPLGGKNKKTPKFPKVLLSGYDMDPLDSSKTVTLSPRHHLIYQRFEDIKEGIYWINTQSPMAMSILDKYGVHSVRWRDYLFQRYVEIFMKEALHELQKRDPESFKADRVDNDIMGELIRKVHMAAAEDLGQFFTEENVLSDQGENNPVN